MQTNKTSDLIQSENQICLSIIDDYHKIVKSCHNPDAPFLNIAAVFFHDVIRILTSYALLKFHPRIDSLPFNIESYTQKTYPYISYSDAFHTIDPNTKDFTLEAWSVNNKSKTLDFISNLTSKFSKKTTFAFTPIFELENTVLFNLFIKGFHIKTTPPNKMGTPNTTEQINKIRTGLTELINNPKHQISDHNIIEIVIQHLIARTTSTIITPDYDVLVCGPMQRKGYNIIAANARHFNKPVITISHGEGDQVLTEEPKFGYSEFAYPTHIFGYGPKGNSQYKDNIHTKPLFSSPPKYICGNSNLISKIYNSNKISSFTDFSKLKWMYVPDCLILNRRYGPFSFINEVTYTQWQKHMLAELKPIFYKYHPKGHPLISDIPMTDLQRVFEIPQETEVLHKNFKEVYQKADGYIFDMIATAFMVACATTKPVIYFNIGKRNITSEAEKIVKKRCIWIDINPENPGKLIESINQQSNTIKTNELTKSYSLSENSNLSREEEFIEYLTSTFAQK